MININTHLIHIFLKIDDYLMVCTKHVITSVHRCRQNHENKVYDNKETSCIPADNDALIDNINLSWGKHDTFPRNELNSFLNRFSTITLNHIDSS